MCYSVPGPRATTVQLYGNNQQLWPTVTYLNCGITTVWPTATYLPTYLQLLTHTTKLPTYLPTYQLLTYQQLPYLPTYLQLLTTNSYLPTYLQLLTTNSYLPTYLPTTNNQQLPTYLPTNSLTTWTAGPDLPTLTTTNKGYLPTYLQLVETDQTVYLV